jgi:hypothetical protein
VSNKFDIKTELHIYWSIYHKFKLTLINLETLPNLIKSIKKFPKILVGKLEDSILLMLYVHFVQFVQRFLPTVYEGKAIPVTGRGGP